MDHHCPWTVNCVSHRTLPHFFQFLCYAVMSMSYLEVFLYLQIAELWSNRNLPSVREKSKVSMAQLNKVVSRSISCRPNVAVHPHTGKFHYMLCRWYLTSAYLVVNMDERHHY